ncbi:unnamed protein product, partial [Symbiodinium sp. KB8]
MGGVAATLEANLRKSLVKLISWCENQGAAFTFSNQEFGQKHSLKEFPTASNSNIEVRIEMVEKIAEDKRTEDDAVLLMFSLVE